MSGNLQSDKNINSKACIRVVSISLVNVDIDEARRTFKCVALSEVGIVPLVEDTGLVAANNPLQKSSINLSKA